MLVNSKWFRLERRRSIKQMRGWRMQQITQFIPALLKFNNQCSGIMGDSSFNFLPACEHPLPYAIAGWWISKLLFTYALATGKASTAELLLLYFWKEGERERKKRSARISFNVFISRYSYVLLNLALNKETFSLLLFTYWYCKINKSKLLFPWCADFMFFFYE